MDMPANAFKRALKDGRRQIGLWCQLRSNIVAEVLAGAGFDWIVIDTEHAPNDLGDVLSQLQALWGGTATPIVRPAWNDPVLFKRFLDIGAPALIVPMVQNEDEAGRAVAACRYPPRGIRGVALTHRANRYGRVKEYVRRVEDETCLIIQVETRAAVDRIGAIAKVDGVDGIFIGPSDLAADCGHLGNPAHPDVQALIATALQRCRAANMPAGILTSVEADAQRYLDAGFTFVAVGSDLGLLARQSEALARRFKETSIAT